MLFTFILLTVLLLYAVIALIVAHRREVRVLSAGDLAKWLVDFGIECAGSSARLVRRVRIGRRVGETGRVAQPRPESSRAAA